MCVSLVVNVSVLVYYFQDRVQYVLQPVIALISECESITVLIHFSLMT